MSSRLYFYEVLLNFNESPVAMRVISEKELQVKFWLVIYIKKNAHLFNLLKFQEIN